MKIAPEHYNEMWNAIAFLAPKITEHKATLIRVCPSSVDIPLRLRWDALNAAKGNKWICDTLYPYADDSHIDTALRNIMAELGF